MVKPKVVAMAAEAVEVMAAVMAVDADAVDVVEEEDVDVGVVVATVVGEVTPCLMRIIPQSTLVVCPRM